ncbi:hypothetical protein EJB05_01853, partial [Eragrostis curvula]
MSLGSEGSEQLLDSPTKKNSGGQDIGESSDKATAADTRAFGEAGSRAPAAPVTNPVDPPPKDAAMPPASALDKADGGYQKLRSRQRRQVDVLHAGHAEYNVHGSNNELEDVPVYDANLPQGIREGLEGTRDFFLNRNERLRESLEERIATVENNVNQRFNDHENAMTLRLTALTHEIHQLAQNLAQGGGAVGAGGQAQPHGRAERRAQHNENDYDADLENKKVPFDDDMFHSQYGLCTFQLRYFGRRSKVPSAQNDDGTECYLLASKIEAAEPIFSPDYESTSTFQPCCKAFRSSCKVISGRIAVEEFVAAGIWPVGSGWKADGFVERRVGGQKFRYLCLIFNELKKPEGLRPKQFVEMVEDVANLLYDPFTAVEAQDVEEGLLPKCRVNRIFDNLKITYPDHEVPRGRRRLKKGTEPEIPTTCYIQMRGWEKKAKAIAEASPSTTASARSASRVAARKMKASTAASLSTIKVEHLKRKRTVCRGARGAAGPDSTRTGSYAHVASGNTERASGSHAEEASVIEGNAELDDEMPPVFELSDSEVLLDDPKPEVFPEEPVIELSDSEEFLDGSGQQVDMMTVDDSGPAHAVQQMVLDTQSTSGCSSETSDSDTSGGSSSSAESSSGAVNYDEISSVATAMMSGLREFDPEELWINLESNSAPDLAKLLERQGRVETSRVLCAKVSSGGTGEASAELAALHEEKAQWGATKASFENEIRRLKAEAKKHSDDLVAYKTETEKAHAEALSKSFSDLLARYGRSAQNLPVVEEVTLDTLLSWLEKEFKLLPGLVNMMCDHGARTCLFAMLDLMKKKQVISYRDIGTSTVTSADFAATDAHMKDAEIDTVAKRFWRNYWLKVGTAAARESALIRAREAVKKKRKGSSSGNPSSIDEEAKAKKAKADAGASASKAIPPKPSTPQSSDPKTAAALEVSTEEPDHEPLCYQN